MERYSESTAVISRTARTVQQRIVSVNPPADVEHTGSDAIELTITGGELRDRVTLEFPYDPGPVPPGMQPEDVFAVVSAETGCDRVVGSGDDGRHPTPRSARRN